ncbi:hypothetical protein KEM48_009210 [Puccinia striiformis f. sp. tritici PST-130]|uniref:Importin-7/11-like TPR repeats domain-containing protein n=1 Tax=Puccinia striiformis f. sp. tritici PST-78 TaxID=1165861 RepID=A0A0L0V9M0_9BASI|nr:hypothetical protein Pst134EB_029960 [Puccinia striiformis f. sp. tritici]KAI9623983.1 hypothetical protein KEM48_009210 [Puccinia striiformis f. sp. tritici PST-130]KNE95975.1 hypothetical protein PSTG_10666 [Puccinia striiformis f. sp. tritici PST-78]
MEANEFQELEGILQDPKESYTFITKHGKNPSILPFLVQILTEPAYEEKSALRTQAVILIRNALDSWYRKLSPNQIENSAKIELGKTLVDNLLARGEKDSIVRKQVTLCLGKIGKSNLDSNLSNLFDDLTSHIRNVLGADDWARDPANFYVLNGCLGAFYQIIQNLISNRSTRGQLLLREVASTHFSHIQAVYSIAFEIWTSTLSSATFTLSALFHSQPVIDLSRICLKILSQFSTYAWKEPHQHELPSNFLNQSIQEWVKVLTIRQTINQQIMAHKTILNNRSTEIQIQSFLTLLHKHLYKYGKLIIQILEQDSSYLNLVEFSNRLKQTVWEMVEQGSLLLPANTDTAETGNMARYPERVIIQSMRIMRLWITNPHHHHLQTTLTSQQSTELSIMIVQKLLKLQPHSLQFWNQDPEAFDNEDLHGSSFEENINAFDLRACAAYLLTSLLSGNPGPISVLILQLYSNLNQQDPSDLATILEYESVYFAIGLAAHHFVKPESGFDLDHWITQTFMAVLCQTHTSGAILRRRIAWVLGQFAKQDLKRSSQSHIYTALSCLLTNPHNDIAVKLATCRALKSTANWENTQESQEPDPILAHLPTFIKEISALLSTVENLESQKILTETMRLVIEKAGSNIGPYALELSNIMACLWQQVDESPSKNNIGNHLHNAIIVTITALVEAIGPSSQEYHGTTLVFVEHAINPSNPSSVYLQEDGLILWLTILRQSVHLTPDLSKLLMGLSTLIGDANDSLAILLKILQSYLLLDSRVVLETIGSLLAVNFSHLMSLSLGLAPTKAILHSIESIVQCAEPLAWQKWLEQSDCFLQLIHRSVSIEDQVLLVVKHILTVSRIIVTDLTSFFNVIEGLNGRGISSTDVLSSFCKTCIDKMDNVGSAQDRKLIGSALAYLIRLPTPVISSHLYSFVSIWCSVLAEGDEILNPETNTYAYLHETEEVDEFQFIHIGAEESRLTQVMKRDPVRTRTLHQIISDQIQAGGPLILSALNSLDPTLIDELKLRLSGNLKG